MVKAASSDLFVQLELTARLSHSSAMVSNNTDQANSTTVHSLNTENPSDGGDGLEPKHIGIIVGVLLGVLVITALVLFILLRKRKAQHRSKQQTSGGDVYEPTTVPLDEESKGMLKAEQMELKDKNGQDQSKDPATPTKPEPGIKGQDANESSAVLVDNDGNTVAA